MYKALFWASTWAGRPFVNINRTRKIIRWLAHRAYAQERPQPSDFRWYCDRYGIRYLLHPHYHVDYQLIAFGTYDRALNSFFERNIKPGMVCIDAGANIGVMSMNLARKVGPLGRVYGFEPDPHIFERLKRHVLRNHLQSIISLHRCAFSDKSGQAAMGICDRQFHIQGLGSLVNRELPQLTSEAIVQTTSLDDFVSQEKLSRLDLIKIDIQGAEPLMLAGGRQTLKRFGPELLMEVSPGDLKGCGRNSVDLLRQVEELGYDIFELKKSGRTGIRLSSSQIAPNYYKNAVLCRKKH